MATRSCIALNKRDVITAVYCHWDGYPDYVGRVLHSCYDDEDKIAELLEHGDISSLGEDLESCVFYHRDRGEPLRTKTYGGVRPRRTALADDEWLTPYMLAMLCNMGGMQYMYLFQNGEWLLARRYIDERRFAPWEPLTPHIQ